MIDEAGWAMFADVLAALIRRTGATVVEFEADELRRGDNEVVRLTPDEDGCVRAEITTEVHDAHV
jgi:hypothetical protein